MPPKRKAAAAKGGPAAKKGKKAAAPAAEEAPETMKDKITALKQADKGKVKKYKPDSYCTVYGASVHEDYDAMLNQTNIGHNNNKFYVIQVLTNGSGTFWTWNRWGRVGESGQNSLKGPFGSAGPAIKDFEKKFKDKTRNNWADRASFKAMPGKYTLLEMAGDDEDDVDAGPAVSVPSNQKVAKCTLDPTTQSLLKLIFNQDMFRDAMKKFDIDVKKMPLGKLSKAQIAKGFEVLEEIEEAINKKSPKNRLQMLSSQFYTAVPHDFGRRTPPVIDNAESLQKRYDMLAVLGDIELAQSMQKDKVKATQDEEEVPHPLDVDYGLLKTKLSLVDPKSNEYKILEKYFQATKPTPGSWRNLKLNHIWSVGREGEDDRFKVHDSIKERKLLWHGTNVAVVAAIMKTGLRIMPHSGGRVGKGIYFASENDKSAGYVGCAGKKGIMFLNEVALGKQKVILRDDSSLTKAPAGFDSVLAKGQQEPDEAFDATLSLDGRMVVVPQAKPKSTGVSSSFYQSEYLIYKENQNRIRYLLLFDF